MSNAQNRTVQPKNMRTFLIIWVGQFISMIGSGLTGFGLSVWVYSETGQATPFAINALAFNLPRILFAPIAGSIADRFNRKRIMILADTAAAVITAGLAVLIFTDQLQIWHIYIASALSSTLALSRNRLTAPPSPCWYLKKTWHERQAYSKLPAQCTRSWCPCLPVYFTA